MADRVCNSLVISYLNIHGQTGLQFDKQLQIEEFVKYSRSDIIHLQEIDIQDDTFNECNFIKSNFTVITNNAGNKYGTASLVKNDLPVENIMCDTAGRGGCRALGYGKACKLLETPRAKRKVG